MRLDAAPTQPTLPIETPVLDIEPETVVLSFQGTFDPIRVPSGEDRRFASREYQVPYKVGLADATLVKGTFEEALATGRRLDRDNSSGPIAILQASGGYWALDLPESIRDWPEAEADVEIGSVKPDGRRYEDFLRHEWRKEHSSLVGLVDSDMTVDFRGPTAVVAFERPAAPEPSA